MTHQHPHTEPQVAPRTIDQLRADLQNAASKTPSTVLDALIHGHNSEVNGIKFPPISISTWLLLEKIDSPFVRAVQPEMTAAERIQALITAAYVLSQPSADVSRAIRIGSLQDEVDQFASHFRMRHIEPLGKAIQQLIADEFAPTAQLGKDGDSPLSVSSSDQALDPS